MRQDLSTIREEAPDFYKKLSDLGVAKEVAENRLEDYIVPFTSWLKVHSTPKAYYHQTVYLNKLKDVFPDNLGNYNTYDIAKIINSHKKKKGGDSAHSTKKYLLYIMNSVYRWANNEGHLDYNPCTDVRIDKTRSDKIHISKSKSQKIIDRKEIDRLITLYSKNRPRIACLLKICAAFGPRTSEIRDIHPKNVNGQNIDRKFAKYGADRTLKMTPEQREAVEFVSERCKEADCDYWDWIGARNIEGQVQHLVSKYCDTSIQEIRKYVSIFMRNKYDSLTESLYLSHLESTAERNYRRDFQQMADLVGKRIP